LGNPHQRWVYDQLMFFQPSEANNDQNNLQDIIQNNDHSKKKRRGRWETAEEKRKRWEFILWRNKRFNKKMQLISFFVLLVSSSIFIDHYLPLKVVDMPLSHSNSLQNAWMEPERIWSVLTNEGKIVSLNAVGKSEEHISREGIGRFSYTPLCGVLATVKIGNVDFKTENRLHDFMLIYGLVSIACFYVLFFKPEKSIFIPTIFTFFSFVLVGTFYVLWLTK